MLKNCGQRAHWAPAGPGGQERIEKRGAKAGMPSPPLSQRRRNEVMVGVRFFFLL